MIEYSQPVQLKPNVYSTDKGFVSTETNRFDTHGAGLG